MRIFMIIFILYLSIACNNKDQNQAIKKEEVTKQEYLQKGMEIAKLTQAELLKNVSQAMQKGGPGYAIEFCNLRALVLKDSLSQMHNCQIRRIALKYRNPVDMPQTETEKTQLQQYQEAFQEGRSMSPQVFLFDDHVEYYQPIMLASEACLKCHGHPGQDIAEETLKKIKERYPDDRATGFALNDLRGAWKITF